MPRILADVVTFPVGRSPAACVPPGRAPDAHLRPLLPTPDRVDYRHYVAVLHRVAGFGP